MSTAGTSASLRACLAHLRSHSPIGGALQHFGSDERVDEEGLSPLMLAAQAGDAESVARLLRLRPGWQEEAEHNGRTALMLAAAAGHAAVVELLLRAGAAVTPTDRDGWTALMLACEGGHESAACVLLVRGASPAQGEADGWTALLVACESGHEGCARLLLDARAAVEQADRHGGTALMVACQEGHLGCARLLLSRGADVNRANLDGWTALTMACQEGQLSCARLLLEHGASLSSASTGFRDGHGATQLLMASCNGGHLECARLLLDSGADARAANEDGGTALMLACQEGHIDCVRLLLERGADVNQANQGVRRRSYCCAGPPSARAGLREPIVCARVRFCLRRARDASACRATLLSISSFISFARPLSLSPGMNTNPKHAHHDTNPVPSPRAAALTDGWTALMMACQEGHVECARLLLEHRPLPAAPAAAAPCAAAAAPAAATCSMAASCDERRAAVACCQPQPQPAPSALAPSGCASPPSSPARLGAPPAASGRGPEGAAGAAAAAMDDGATAAAAAGQLPSLPGKGSSVPRVESAAPAVRPAIGLAAPPPPLPSPPPPADVNKANCDGGTALAIACADAGLPVIQLLSAHGALRFFPNGQTAESVARAAAERRGVPPAECPVLAWLRRTREWVTPLHHLELLGPAATIEHLRAGADVRSHSSAPDAPTPVSIARALARSGGAPPGSAAALVLRAAQPWSPHTHALFPASARARACELLRLGYQLAAQPRFAGASRQLQDVWVAHVLPHAVKRPPPARSAFALSWRRTFAGAAQCE